MDPSIVNNIVFNLRNERNKLLFDTDKYVLPDFPITPENLEIVKEYRQQLRDFFQRDEIQNLSIPNLPSKPKFIK